MGLADMLCECWLRVRAGQDDLKSGAASAITLMGLFDWSQIALYSCWRTFESPQELPQTAKKS